MASSGKSTTYKIALFESLGGHYSKEDYQKGMLILTCNSRAWTNMEIRKPEKWNKMKCDGISNVSGGLGFLVRRI